MNKLTKEKKIEQKKDKLKSKYLEEPEMALDKYFPKGSKKRGEALAVLVLAFINGIKCGEEYGKLK